MINTSLPLFLFKNFDYQRKGILEDSIIVFTTDNGGPAAGFDLNAASNWPLRGGKAYLWEGGTSILRASCRRVRRGFL